MIMAKDKSTYRNIKYSTKIILHTMDVENLVKRPVNEILNRNYYCYGL